MASHDQIVVWMNGKKTTIKRSEAKLSSQDAIVKDEHAATVDKQPYERNDTLELPSVKKNGGGKKHHTSKNASRRKWKPIIIAITSAVCIGAIFGLIMLKIVGTLGDYGTPQPTANGISSNTNNENNESIGSDNEGNSSYTLSQMEAYVLQGGVFEKETSVNDWKESFQDATFFPVVWQDDGNYYLLVGMAETKENGKATAENIKETYGLDVFAKEWHTNEKKLDLNQDEQQWMDSVMELWNESLVSIDESSEFPTDDWKNIQKQIPGEGKQLESFQEKLKQLISDLDNPSDHEVAGFLLQVWHAIEYDLQG